MTIQELFIRSNQELRKVVDQITDEQWELALPAHATPRPANLRDAVRYHTYDDAWVPDVLAGKTIEEVGDVYDGLKQNNDMIAEYDKYNQRAIEAVKDFDDLERIVHLSYGDFTAKQYLQHITSFRAVRAY